MGLRDWSVQYEKGSRRRLSLSDSSRYLSAGTLRNHRRGRHFRGHVTICNGHVHVSSAADADEIAAMAAAGPGENGEARYRNSIFVDAMLAGDEQSDEEGYEEDYTGHSDGNLDDDGDDDDEEDDDDDDEDDDDDDEEDEDGEEEPAFGRSSIWNPSTLSRSSRPTSSSLSSRRRGGGTAAREARRQFRDDFFLAMLQRVGDAAVESFASGAGGAGSSNGSGGGNSGGDGGVGNGGGGESGGSGGGAGNGVRGGRLVRSSLQSTANAAASSSTYELWDPEVDFDYIWDTVQPASSGRVIVPRNFRSRGAGNA